MLRERFSADLKDAMKAKDAARLSTLRLITAAIKDRDIALRTQGTTGEASEADILAVLARMIKQRQESAKAFEEGGRTDLAERELSEIKVIREYLPEAMSEDEEGQAIAEAIANTGAVLIRDMGRVMAELKARHPGRMDFARASAAIKVALA